MKITNWKEAPEKKNPHGVKVHLLYDQKDAEAVHIQLEPGESLKPHITPVDVFFFILEGNPRIHIGEEEQDAKEGDMVESPKDIVHHISNPTEQKARILVVKTPKPDKGGKVL